MTPNPSAALAERIAQAVADFEQVPLPAQAKLRTCLFDFIGCTFETRHLPWSQQALRVAAAGANDATLIGQSQRASAGDAAFVNAVMGHGLVREDMHAGSVSHLGIVVLPVLLALAELRPVSGRDFIAAAVAGYEVGGRVGRALMDADIARIHRPTGIAGPLAAAAAGARLWRLPQAQVVSAIALAANVTGGFNQWAHTGGSEMFFHAGFAARNAVAAVQLAAAGAFASPSALDGDAGLFAAFGKTGAAQSVHLLDGEPEILSVYHKPLPACNFAQTPAQAALALARSGHCPPGRIAAVQVRVSRAGALYPGCDYAGHFEHVLQAKMSIQYAVARALLSGTVDERGFEQLDDPALHRLMACTTLVADDALTAAFPRQQGAAVEVRLVDGSTHAVKLDDVVHASDDEVRQRFRAAMAAAANAGPARCRQVEALIDQLAEAPAAGELARLLGGSR